MGAQGIMSEQTAPAEAAISASTGRFQVLRSCPVAYRRRAAGGSEGEGSISVCDPGCGRRAAIHARGKALQQTEGRCEASVVGTVVSWATIGGPVAVGGGSGVPRREAISAAHLLLARCHRVSPARMRREASSAEHAPSARASTRLETSVAATAPEQQARAMRGTLSLCARTRVVRARCARRECADRPQRELVLGSVELHPHQHVCRRLID